MARTIFICFLVFSLAAAVLAADFPTGQHMQGVQDVGQAASNQYPVLVAGRDAFGNLIIPLFNADGSINVNFPAGSTVTANQGTPNGGGAAAWPVTFSTPIGVTQSTSPWIVGFNGVGQPVTQSGTWTVQQGTPPWSVSGTVTANQGGAPWSVSQSGTWTVQQGTPPWSVSQSGAWSVGQSGAPWTQRIQDGVGATLATVTAGNALKVDGSAVTQPVSGTVTANQGTPNAAGTNSWPVQGAVADGGTPGNAVVSGILDASSKARSLASAALADGQNPANNVLGAVMMCRNANTPTYVAVNGSGLVADGDNGGRSPVFVLQVQTGATASKAFSLQRTPFVFKTVQATASGSTALWTPAAGRKFRLMRYSVFVTDNAIRAAAGVLTVSLLDSAADIAQDHDIFVPSSALDTTGALYSSGWIDLGNGVLSAAANNVLNVNLSAALTAGNVRVIACGTEE
jgi:hypothetical protein